MLRGVLEKGEATWSEDQLLLLDRNGYLEECYFTFSYSPIRSEAGEVGGVFTAVTENTERILGERRLRALQELGATAVRSTNAEEACRLAAEVLADYAADIPFALIYLVDAERKIARLAAPVQVEHGSEVAPDEVDLHSSSSPWPIAEVLANDRPIFIKELTGKLATLPGGPWPEHPRSAVVLPIAASGENEPTGVLIAGISPRRAYDDQYQAFFGLVVRDLAAAIADARAYEDQQRRTEALAELDRAKTAFFSNVSHEFRTPLTLMLGPLEDVLANSDRLLATRDREQLTLVHRNSLRLLKLVNSLLDFSRIEAGRVEAVYEPTDFAAFTEELASSFRSAMERAGLRFEIVTEPLDEPIYLDRDMWEKVVLNLLSNAFKFTFSGSVSVRVRSAGDSVEFEVRDTGIGIREEDQEHLFERFRRVEGARGRTHEGTGIGLALVQELVKLHKGTIRVSSTEGGGSTFTVNVPKGTGHLPQDRIGAPRTLASSAIHADSYVEEALRWLPTSAVSEGGAEAPMPPSLAAQQSGARSLDASPLKVSAAEPGPEANLIVVADDNSDMREYLRRLLSDRYRVIAVPNGEEAIKAARERKASLILSDVMMPGLDGFGVLREVRNDPSLQSMPVILLSARAGEESRVEGLQAGADDYLVKPFTARELLARVGTHLKMADVRAQAAAVERQLRAEADLERNRLLESFKVAPAAMALLSGPSHRFAFVNEAYLRLIGRTDANQILNKPVQEALPEIKGQGFAELLNQVYDTGEPFVASERELRLVRDGNEETVYVSFSYQAMRNLAGAVEGILVHAIDVTEQVLARTQLEQRVKERTLELSEAEERLRVLSGRLLQARDDERRRLARELHDSAGQMLAALKMNLVPLQSEVARYDQRLQHFAEGGIQIVDDLSKELRTMSYLLHPPLLDEAGLPSALRWYVEGFSQRSGIDVNLALDPGLPRLPREVETTIFRIVQESLTNIHRHSGSKSATLTVVHDDTGTRVRIEDRGSGIAEYSAVSRMPMRVGVGVQGMQERVRQLGGKFQIESSKNGTAVTVALPSSGVRNGEPSGEVA